MTTFEEGKQLFETEHFADAKSVFQKALASTQEDAEVKKLKMWIRKCDSHLEELKEEQKTAPSAEALPAPQQSPPPPPQSNKSSVRHEWFQTITSLTFSFFVKGRKPEDVKVDATSRSLEVSIQLDEGKEYQCSFENFFHEVDATSVKTDVRSMKIEVQLQKVTPAQWPALESATSQVAAIPKAVLPASQKELPVPNSKGKDWNKFKLSEEEEKELDGDAGMNKFFKEIYSGCTDDQRKAMMKSMQESGGTVLSTNWEDVGKRHVTCEAPKGMEVRKWEV